MSRPTVQKDIPMSLKEEILSFIYGRQEASYTDLVESFVSSGKCAKATLLKYKGELEVEGNIEKRISKATNRPVYYVPSEQEAFGRLVKRLGESELEEQEIKLSGTVHKLISQADLEKLKKTKKMKLVLTLEYDLTRYLQDQQYKKEKELKMT